MRNRLHANASTTRAALAGIAIAFGCLAGCANHDKGGGIRDEFPSENEIRPTDTIAAAQAAAGARADAMLYRHHFDDGQLNSLGRSKLFLMVHDRPAGMPLVLYTDFPVNDPGAVDRRRSIEQYLGDLEYPIARVEFRAGPNPTHLSPAANGISRLPKVETGDTESSGKSTTDSFGPSEGFSSGNRNQTAK